jgi:hypothetical protein
MGKEKAVSVISKRAEEAKVPLERVEENFGKKEAWDLDKMIMVIGAIRMVEEGYGTINDAFPKGGLPETEETDHDKDPDNTGDNPDVDKNSKQEVKQKPEVKSVQIDDSPQKEPIILSVTDWEVPIKVISKIESIRTLKELAEFKRENKQRLTTFTGKDHSAIQKALVDQEQKIKSGQ